MKIAIKPQNLAQLAKFKIPVLKFLAKFAKKSEIEKLADELAIAHVLEKDLNELSGGELQKVAILASTLKEADIYFLDEPLAYLDISERIRVSNYIQELCGKNKAVIIVEHDLLLLDYVTDYVHIIYGKPGCYGIISEIRAAKKAINTYLSGFLKEENIRFRDKAITFNFGAKRRESSTVLMEWPDFTKSYPKFELKVNAGSINTKSVVGIAGRNAIGKTTFVKCLANVIETNEKNLQSKAKVSYKPQYLEEESEELVIDIIKREKINSRLISLLSLESLFMRQLNQLSGGELQRLAIAACLAKDADIYLIDEPSAYLDVEERLQAARAIEETVKEKEKAAFVVDHDLLFLSYLADSMIVFSGEPGKSGSASQPYPIVQGMNALLKLLDITLRRDEETGRPRINKHDSVLDREQRKKGNWFEI
jgi:ATP-binding cassette subfamily E protein 1